MHLVRELLEGASVDSGELGYDLAGSHVAIVAWGEGAETALTALAGNLRAQLLLVAVSGQTVWAWLGAAPGDDRTLRNAAADVASVGDTAFAVGRAASGLDGFRASYSDARAAHRIGASTLEPVTFYDDVALESLLLGDERAARAFVAAELAPLDQGRDGSKLRETLRAYFASGFNASAAAALLNVNDRTVAYRLSTIEERLGRSVRSRQAELQAALRLERVIGRTLAHGP